MQTKFGYCAEQLGVKNMVSVLLYFWSVFCMDDSSNAAWVEGWWVEDAKEAPEEKALNFVCAMLENPYAVLQGSRHMVRLCKQIHIIDS